MQWLCLGAFRYAGRLEAHCLRDQLQLLSSNPRKPFHGQLLTDGVQSGWLFRSFIDLICNNAVVHLEWCFNATPGCLCHSRALDNQASKTHDSFATKPRADKQLRQILTGRHVPFIQTLLYTATHCTVNPLPTPPIVCPFGSPTKFPPTATFSIGKNA